MTQEGSHGRRLVEGIAAKDHAALHRLLDPQVDFRAMTPRRFWEGTGPEDVCAALSQWFDDGDDVVEVLRVDVEDVADVQHVGYRLHVVSGGLLHVVDQQAYLAVRDDRVSWLRVMCAGFRPVGPAPAGPVAAQEDRP